MSAVQSWREDIERADADTQPIRFGAVEAAKLIERLTYISDDEIVAICSALFRAIEPSAHITSRRCALAALSDVVADHARGDEEPEDPTLDEWCRKYHEQRDTTLEQA